MNLITTLTILSIIPSVILGAIIYKNDQVEKEPGKLLISLFLGGIIIVYAVIFVTNILKTTIPFFDKNISELPYFEMFLSILFGIALIEEGFKWIVFKKLAWNNKSFDYMYDSIVYMVFIGLGFATVENFIYVVDGGLWVAIIRALCSVPGHVFFAIYMGYYYGLARQSRINGNKKLEKINLLKSLLVPIILHTIFNFCLFAGDSRILFFYIVFVVILYIRSFKKVHQLSKIKLKMNN
ncbi:MAG: PrsW family glutamic-type intramembrane protease [Bacilli bacterium]